MAFKIADVSLARDAVRPQRVEREVEHDGGGGVGAWSTALRSECSIV